ncbi:MAG: type I DNA topoisomerase [Muribaculaceae bacterium]|nr:type I DNA topoisomerase [Muribaculaceae bacterium]
MKNLVIVESPAKAKTIEKFLGKDFTVMSSYGHIRDLKKHGLSIDVDNKFLPEYEIPEDKKDLVSRLRKAAKSAETVWLASDEDREGEAIAWHLAEVLELDPSTTNRIVFHEITKPAIVNAIANPRRIDIDRVNAQQARRVLDRIVGFELSPVLWKKIKPALSAGRVQSVAVRLICERENEIRNFVPEIFYKVSGVFMNSKGQSFKGELKERISDLDEARTYLELCKKASFKVDDISVKPLSRSPYPPFTTSTLQQEAARKLGFSVSRTMLVAQKLYEAGKITYMRTDSTNLSKMALAEIKKVVESEYGEDFLKLRNYHTRSKGAQEAHEAIRPTYISNHSIEGTPDEKKLYDLIWKRAVASQMADAELEKTTVEIKVEPGAAPNLKGVPGFRAEGEVVKFEGFLKIWKTENARNQEFVELPSLINGEELGYKEITAAERYTQAPPRYSEATLVKKMEDLGIGRPSTYSPTITTIQNRDYIRKGESDGIKREYLNLILNKGEISEKRITEMSGSDKGKLVPTDVGMVVNEFLTAEFPEILDYNFTAKVEEKFDDIAEGKLGWQQEIYDFYSDFHPGIEKITAKRGEHKVGERLIGIHPENGKPVFVKIGRFGPVVQIGNSSDQEKPMFASLHGNQSISSITMDEALKLFELPRIVGEFNGETVTAAEGRFGPYLKMGSLFVSIPKDKDPYSITITEATELITRKMESEANKVIKQFSELPGLEVLNGRFGPYLAYKPEGAKKAQNFRLPKGIDATEISFEEARKIMEEASSKGKNNVVKNKNTKKSATKTKKS